MVGDPRKTKKDLFQQKSRYSKCDIENLFLGILFFRFLIQYQFYKLKVDKLSCNER